MPRPLHSLGILEKIHRFDSLTHLVQGVGQGRPGDHAHEGISTAIGQLNALLSYPLGSP
jgi:hypothetical protein